MDVLVLCREYLERKFRIEYSRFRVSNHKSFDPIHCGGAKYIMCRLYNVILLYGHVNALQYLIPPNWRLSTSYFTCGVSQPA